MMAIYWRLHGIWTNDIVVFMTDTLATRGERLELLVDKTEDLSSGVSHSLIILT